MVEYLFFSHKDLVVSKATSEEKKRITHHAQYGVFCTEIDVAIDFVHTAASTGF